MPAAPSHSYGFLSTLHARRCKIPYTSAAAAAATPSDSLCPSSGSANRSKAATSATDESNNRNSMGKCYARPHLDVNHFMVSWFHTGLSRL